MNFVRKIINVWQLITDVWSPGVRVKKATDGKYPNVSIVKVGQSAEQNSRIGEISAEKQYFVPTLRSTQ